jgi:hypothetical protein
MLGLNDAMPSDNVALLEALVPLTVSLIVATYVENRIIHYLCAACAGFSAGYGLLWGLPVYLPALDGLPIAFKLIIMLLLAVVCASGLVLGDVEMWKFRQSVVDPLRNTPVRLGVAVVPAAADRQRHLERLQVVADAARDARAFIDDHRGLPNANRRDKGRQIFRQFIAYYWPQLRRSIDELKDMGRDGGLNYNPYTRLLFWDKHRPRAFADVIDILTCIDLVVQERQAILVQNSASTPNS